MQRELAVAGLLNVLGSIYIQYVALKCIVIIIAISITTATTITILRHKLTYALDLCSQGWNCQLTEEQFIAVKELVCTRASIIGYKF